MRKLVAGVLCGGLIALCLWSPSRSIFADDSTRIAPASGGVEIADISIARRSVLGAVKDADLTNMHLKLWFAAEWESVIGSHSPALVHLKELSAIEDDTGRLLSTEARRKYIYELEGEVRQNTWRGGGGEGGPVMSLKLDAPARGADKIKAIQGKAEVTLTKQVELTFKDLAAISGEFLDHPDLKALRDMKLWFAVSEKNGKVSAQLSAPEDFSSPRNRGRLYFWDIMNGEEKLHPSSIGGVGKGEGGAEEKTYRDQTIKGLTLRLVVLEPVETKTFKFHFKDVELP